METFSFEDLSIRYTRVGSGPPIVFLHNGGTSHAIWADVISRVDGFEMFALDLLGFGESSKPESGYELARYVAILGAFIDELELAPVRLVGNCMGSAISLCYAMRHARSVRAMVLINTLTPNTFSNGIFARMYTWPQRVPALVSAMSKVPLGTSLGKYGVRSQLGHRGRTRRIDERPELRACYANASQSRALLKVLADIPNYGVLDGFRAPSNFAPICTLWGLDNRVLRATEGRMFVNTLRPARQEWLEGCGHLPMLECPEQVTDMITSFFADVAGSQTGTI